MNFPLSPKDDAKMRTAFEMNLDITPPPTVDPEIPKTSGAAADAKQFFKMLVSPKFGRKTTPSPSIPAKSKISEPPSFTTPSPRSQKTLLGSPRLHRAIFGNSRDKRKKLLDTGDWHLHPFVTEESVITLDERTEADESQSSFNSSLSSEFSPRFSPASVIHHRSLQRPPPLISPLQSPSVSSSTGIIVASPYEDGNGSCPGTPKTPSMKPAMGVSMIGKQRRTPMGPDSPFGLPPSPGPSVGGSSLRLSSSTTRFPYTLTPKEASPVLAPSLIQSTGELEYPPVFEPGTYSLSEKNVEMHVTSTRSSLTSSAMPPVPAPRTKFLSSTASRLSHSPSMDSTSSSTTSTICQQHRVRLESRRSFDESNA